MKFLFFPMQAHGHVNPMLPVIQELVSRGDEVVVYVTREFEAAIRNTGASLRLLDDALGLPASFAGLPMGGDGQAMKKVMPLLMGVMRRSLHETPRLMEQARAERADCVVYDPMAPWGRAAAVMLGLPAAIFQTSFALTYSPTIKRALEANMKGLPPPRALLAIARLLWTSEVLHWRHGLPRMSPRSAFTTVADLNLIPVTRQYQPDVGNFDERFLFVGPSVLPRNDRGDFPLEQLEGKPVLLISLGTTPMNLRPDFYKACFEAFRDTRWQVVMACGKGLDPATLGPAPANVLVRQRVPQLEVLERARVFLTHGGMNSTMEGLWHGVPLAVFPQFGDQPLNASRVTELGLGATLSARDALDPKALRETIERLDTDPGYRTRLAEFQKELREAGGHRRAADALQQFAASRRGSPGQKAA
ncbi:MGT family glycosyltransferase [Archangium gephyra]|uniref:MGT family glycosyltransferase n=1 Tax=Archangium gephyra TaxID=48 RepID=A0AAC8TCV3_9BACT|nr:macrolide family glycosyltransferase [Archangium gephyra]AKJ01213.1 Macrolide glycosyltransferase [Archangium gephyra]REG24473.1 MGT family glycosyltransferase [Archangium gephyra]